MVNRYYICDSCEHSFVVKQEMHAPLKKKCPKCGKRSLYQDLSGQHFFVAGEPTVGKIADRNAKKMGKEAIEIAEQKRKAESKRAKDELARRLGFEPKTADRKTWYNPNGEDLNKKLADKDTPAKQHKYIMEGE